MRIHKVMVDCIGFHRLQVRDKEFTNVIQKERKDIIIAALISTRGAVEFTFYVIYILFYVFRSQFSCVTT